MEIAKLNQILDDLSKWIIKAGEGLMSFYSESYEGLFYYNSGDIASKFAHLHPTTINRSISPLFEYYRFLSEEEYDLRYLSRSELDTIKEKLIEIFSRVTNDYLSLLDDPDPKIKEKIRKSPDNNINMFTDSHLLVSISLVKKLNKLIGIDNNQSYINDSNIIEDFLLKMLNEWKGGKVHEKDEIHDFITLHSIRGLDAFYLSKNNYNYETGHNKFDNFKENLTSRVKDTILRYLAYNSSKITSRFDAPELAFSLSLLNRFPTSDINQLTKSALNAIEESQAVDGSWATSRYISYQKKGLLHVSSYEVALSLCNILFRSIYENNEDDCNKIIDILLKTFELVKSHYIKVNGFCGWPNDHARRDKYVECWATALVLNFLIKFRDALILVKQEKILTKYDTIYPKKDPAKFFYWPDMINSYRSQTRLDDGIINEISDPFDNFELTTKLKEQYLTPISENFIHRPTKNVSFILHGETGTRKTTFVIKMAKGLRWPLIILSPPNFLSNSGLEGLEVSANDIFNDLLGLRRVVILFDECEEFFKKRSTKQDVYNRTEGAFITSGMLPRLQKLREYKWVIFVLNTNIDLEELDIAVRRKGRFDFAQKMSYPTYKAQLNYINLKKEKDDDIDNFSKKIKDVEVLLAKFKKDRIPFSIIDNVYNMMKRDSWDVKEVEKRIKKLLEDLENPPDLVRT